MALRLFYVIALPQTGGDSVYYADVAKNLLAHGSVALTDPNGEPVRICSRLPGYSAFVALVFAVFGVDRFLPLLAVQVAVDLGTCFLTSELARTLVGERAARTAFSLAALCPFLAEYAAGAYAETLAVFLTALALLLLARGLAPCAVSPQEDRGAPPIKTAFLCGAALAAGILVRVDTGILLLAICGYLGREAWRRARRRREWALFTAILAATALSPLLPWTVRNWIVFHRLQPLAPLQAQEPHEHVDGILRWMQTWLVDEISVREVYHRIGVAPVELTALPARAIDSPEEARRTQALLDVANTTRALTPALDNQFAALADERIRRSPLRYCLYVPLLRLASIWLRPRVELLPVDQYWWRFPKSPRDTLVTASLGLLNLFLLTAAGAALIARRRVLCGGLLVTFIVARSLCLSSILPEARYTLECFPAIIVLAAAGLASRRGDERGAFVDSTAAGP